MVTPQADLLDEIRDDAGQRVHRPEHRPAPSASPRRSCAPSWRRCWPPTTPSRFSRTEPRSRGCPPAPTMSARWLPPTAPGLVTVTITGGTGARLRFGTGTPSDSLGANNDSFLATDTGVFFAKAIRRLHRAVHHPRRHRCAELALSRGPTPKANRQPGVATVRQRSTSLVTANQLTSPPTAPSRPGRARQRFADSGIRARGRSAAC